MDEDEVIDFVNMMMEDESLEDFLERFNITSGEVIIALLDNGLIDSRDLKELMGR